MATTSAFPPFSLTSMGRSSGSAAFVLPTTRSPQISPQFLQFFFFGRFLHLLMATKFMVQLVWLAEKVMPH